MSMGESRKTPNTTPSLDERRAEAGTSHEITLPTDTTPVSEMLQPADVAAGRVVDSGPGAEYTFTCKAAGPGMKNVTVGAKLKRRREMLTLPGEYCITEFQSTSRAHAAPLRGSHVTGAGKPDSTSTSPPDVLR
jgi:hypothetical protein